VRVSGRVRVSGLEGMGRPVLHLLAASLFAEPETPAEKAVDECAQQVRP
jgi:hypothetical protein